MATRGALLELSRSSAMRHKYPASPDAKRSYRRPKLSIYGAFSRLTASGSGQLTEGNKGKGQPFRRL